MRVFVIWLVCSVPLILTVINAVKAASGTSTAAELDPPDPGTRPREYSSLKAVSPEFTDHVREFPWFDMPAETDEGIRADVDAAAELKQLQRNSENLLVLNRGLRKLVKGFENPLSRQADLQKFADGIRGDDGEINKLGELPVGESLRRCVSTFISQRQTESDNLKFRTTALENYRKAQRDMDISSLEKVIVALSSLPIDELTDEDREQIRWAKFWKYWLQAKSSRSIVDRRTMEARKELLETLVLGADEADYLAVKADEVKLVEGYGKEIQTLENQIRLESIKEQIRDGSPQSWLADAERLLDQLNEEDARQLTKLIREAVLKRVSAGDVPVVAFKEEAITNGGDLWLGTFELIDAKGAKPYYKFTSTSGTKKSYCYLNEFTETKREPFARTAYNRMTTALTGVKIAPQKKASWQTLLNDASQIRREKEKYLNLNMVAGMADRRLVTNSLESLKLEEICVVCEEILSEDMWPRMEKLLSVR